MKIAACRIQRSSRTKHLCEGGAIPKTGNLKIREARSYDPQKAVKIFNVMDDNCFDHKRYIWLCARSLLKGSAVSLRLYTGHAQRPPGPPKGPPGHWHSGSGQPEMLSKSRGHQVKLMQRAWRRIQNGRDKRREICVAHPQITTQRPACHMWAVTEGPV